MEKLARQVNPEEKIGVKLIVSAQVVKRRSHVASTGKNFSYANIRSERRLKTEPYFLIVGSLFEPNNTLRYYEQVDNTSL